MVTLGLVGPMLRQWLGVIRVQGVVLLHAGSGQVVQSLVPLLRVVSGVWKQACEVWQNCLGRSLSYAC